MFTIREVATSKGILQYREEQFTGIRCRISPERLNRHIDQELFISANKVECPFCRDRVFSETPVFPNGDRILRGESVTFPNLFPFDERHIVTVITREHFVESFTLRQIVDALSGQIESLREVEGYASVNWNYLPSAGASLVHPHMQGLSESHPSPIVEKYLLAGKTYYRKYKKNYWESVKDEERVSDRYLFGDEILWSAHAVPLGEREVRGILPVSTICEIENYIDPLAGDILEILKLYRKLGTHAFNMSIFFDKNAGKNRFSAFCSIISRINPNPSSTSDSAFMERLHLEPVIMTLPEDLGRFYKKEKIK